MKRFCRYLPHILGALAVLVALLPGRREAASPWLLCLLLGLIETATLRARARVGASDIAALAFAAILVWELFTTKLDLANRILIPTPEDVCMVFVAQWRLMLAGVCSSMTLLLTGFAVALPLGVGLGLTVGWRPRLKAVFFPIAKVLSPIPAPIYAPYVVALMPTFRAASATILILGLFWPTFLGVVQRVSTIDKRLLDSARVLELTDREMIARVLLPCVLPGVIGGLRVSISTSFMILTIAEMMGATSGLGYFIRNFADYANYTNVVAGVILVGAVITLLNRGVALLEKIIIRWEA